MMIRRCWETFCALSRLLRFSLSNAVATAGLPSSVAPLPGAAAKRPKVVPLMLPIFSTSPGWKAKTPEQRLAGFKNLKRWLVDDLA